MDDEFLDGPGVQQIGLDKQALDAIERQREIIAARDKPSAVALVDVAEVFDTPQPIQTQPVVPPAPLSPIVKAARDYVAAKERADSAARQIEKLKSDLENAQTLHVEAVTERDVKKSILKDLVA